MVVVMVVVIMGIMVIMVVTALEIAVVQVPPKTRYVQTETCPCWEGWRMEAKE